MDKKVITIYDIWPDYNPNYQPSFGEPMSEKDRKNFERFFPKKPRDKSSKIGEQVKGQQVMFTNKGHSN